MLLFGIIEQVHFLSTVSLLLIPPRGHIPQFPCFWVFPLAPLPSPPTSFSVPCFLVGPLSNLLRKVLCSLLLWRIGFLRHSPSHPEGTSLNFQPYSLNSWLSGPESGIRNENRVKLPVSCISASPLPLYYES